MTTATEGRSPGEPGKESAERRLCLCRRDLEHCGLLAQSFQPLMEETWMPASVWHKRDTSHTYGPYSLTGTSAISACVVHFLRCLSATYGPCSDFAYHVGQRNGIRLQLPPNRERSRQFEDSSGSLPISTWSSKEARFVLHMCKPGLFLLGIYAKLGLKFRSKFMKQSLGINLHMRNRNANFSTDKFHHKCKEQKKILVRKKEGSLIWTCQCFIKLNYIYWEISTCGQI